MSSTKCKTCGSPLDPDPTNPAQDTCSTCRQKKSEKFLERLDKSVPLSPFTGKISER